MPSRTSASRRWLMSSVAGASALALTTAGLALATIPSSASTARHDPTGRDCLAAIGSGPDAQARQRAFDAASRTYGVPARVLLGVSYMESRWDDHGHAPSTSGGYGPLHLTNVSVEQAGDAKGDGSSNRSTGPDSLRTAHVAADLTGLSVGRLTSDDAANICGGAALLASYQRDLGKRTGTSSLTSAWYDAVKTYSGDASSSTRVSSPRESSRRSRRARSARPTTASGSASPPSAASRCRRPGRASKSVDPHVDCPATLHCEWIPAPYEQYGPDPGDYGNHDVANREDDLTIDYIVIHDTEGTYPTRSTWCRTRPTSAGTTRSAPPTATSRSTSTAKDIGFQAGNWYVNMHSIGIEHEGFARTGRTLVHRVAVPELGDAGEVPLQQVRRSRSTAHTSSGTTRCRASPRRNVAGMHWDPGPYWDWEHYFKLLGAPIGKAAVAKPAKAFSRTTSSRSSRGSRTTGSS